MSCTVLPVLYFRTWIFLPAGLCLVSRAFVEPEMQWWCDQSLLKPCPPSKSSWNYSKIFPKRFCWFLNMFYSKALVICWPLSLLCSLLIVGDKHGRISHLLGMAIIAESATIIQDNCVVWNSDPHTLEWLLHEMERELFPDVYCKYTTGSGWVQGRKMYFWCLQSHHGRWVLTMSTFIIPLFSICCHC